MGQLADPASPGKCSLNYNNNKQICKVVTLEALEISGDGGSGDASLSEVRSSQTWMHSMKWLITFVMICTGRLGTSSCLALSVHFGITVLLHRRCTCDSYSECVQTVADCCRLHWHCPTRRDETFLSHQVRQRQLIAPNHLLVIVAKRQTMNHIVDTYRFTKFEGGLNLLHEADDDAVIWLESTATAAHTK